MNQKIKEIIVSTASYFGIMMRPEVLLMYLDDLQDLDPIKVLDAYKSYRKDPRNKINPLPSAIRAIIEPQSNSREQAQEIAQRCFGAIRKFGYTKPDKAKEYIGELGWRLIERRGGWQSHCTETRESDIPILTAQFRESVGVYIEQGNIADEVFFDKVGLISSKDNILMIEQKPKEIEKQENSENVTKVVFEIKRIPKTINEPYFNIETAKIDAIERFKKTFYK